MSYDPPLGVRRRLGSCSDSRGRFTMVAIDHRQNLRRALGSDATEDQLVEFKLAVISALGPLASSVLVDPEYGLAQLVAAGLADGMSGLVVAVEETGYDEAPGGRVSRLLPGWGVEQAVRAGADAVKLLVYYHPDAPTAAAQEELVAEVAAECRRLETPLFLEPLSYRPGGGKLTGPELTEVVVETALRLSAIGGDVLKAEFPAAADESFSWETALAQLDAATRTPWVILSGGVSFDQFVEQAEAAAAAGACGVMVGRAVWAEAVTMDAGSRAKFLTTVARDRLERLKSIPGPGWADRAAHLAPPSPDWYR